MITLTVNTEALNLTDEQFFMFCSQNRDMLIERDSNKNILLMSPTASYTGNENAEILIQIGNWNQKYKLGYVFDSNAGFTLPNEAMRSPDVSWITKEKWENVPQKDKERFAHLCPDFIIELKSKTDSINTLKEKMQEYIENGCRLGWLIDTNAQKVYVYRANGNHSVIDNLDDPISGEDILPDFELVFSWLKK